MQDLKPEGNNYMSALKPRNVGLMLAQTHSMIVGSLELLRCGWQAGLSEKDTRMAVPEVNLMWEQIFWKSNLMGGLTRCSAGVVKFEYNG